MKILENMFKKSNRNFRSKKAEFDSEEEQEKNLSRKNESGSFEPGKKENVEAKNESALPRINTQKILSFEEEQFEEETEFKVRKSKESRRIAKEMKKSRKEKQKQQKSDANDSKKPKEEIVTGEEVLFREGIKVKPLNLQQNKKTSKFVVNKYKEESADEDLEFAEFKKNIESSSSSSSSDEEEEGSKLQVYFILLK